MTIANINGKDLITSTNQFSHTIRNTEQKDIYYNEITNGYALNGGADYFNFVPTLDSGFQLSLNDELLEIEVKDSNGIMINSKNGLYEFEKDKNYQIKVVNNSTKNIPFQIVISLPKLDYKGETFFENIETNQLYSFSYKETGIYNFKSFTNENITLYKSDLVTIIRDGGHNLVEKIIANEIIYIIVRNEVRTEVKLGILIPYEVYIGETIEIECEWGDIFYKLVMENGKSYTISIKNMRDGLEFDAVTKNNDISLSYYVSKTGISYKVDNFHEKELYFGFYNVNSDDVIELEIREAINEITYSSGAVDLTNKLITLKQGERISLNFSLFRMPYSLNGTYGLTEELSKHFELKIENDNFTIVVKNDAESKKSQIQFQYSYIKDGEAVDSIIFISIFIQESVKISNIIYYQQNEILEFRIKSNVSSITIKYNFYGTNNSVKENGGIDHTGLEEKNIKIKLSNIIYNSRNYGTNNWVFQIISIINTKVIPNNEILNSPIQKDICTLFSSGNGSHNNRFTLGDKFNVDNIRYVSDRGRYYYYKVNNDIDLNDWTPISKFYGDIDGNNKTWQNIKIDCGVNPKNIGIFGYIQDSVIERLRINGVNIFGTSKNDGQIGGLAGYMHGTRLNQVNIGGVKIDTVQAKYIGGIAGVMNYCETGGPEFGNYIAADIRGTKTMGGIAGYIKESIINSMIVFSRVYILGDARMVNSEDDNAIAGALYGISYLTNTSYDASMRRVEYVSSVKSKNKNLMPIIGNFVGINFKSSQYIYYYENVNATYFFKGTLCEWKDGSMPWSKKYNQLKYASGGIYGQENTNLPVFPSA